MKFYNNFRFNGLIISIIMALFITLPTYAQSTAKHIVAKGETIESIAKSYGITPEQLIEANPSIKQYLFVGAKLIIPAKKEKTSSTTQDTESRVKSHSVASASKNDRADNNHRSSYDKWKPTMSIGYGFLSSNEVKKGAHYSFIGVVGVNYHFSPQFYVGLKAGYHSANSWNYEYYSSQTLNMFVIPIETGYKFDITQEFSIAPYAGIDYDIFMSGKRKIGVGSDTQTYKLKIGGKMALSPRIGVRFAYDEMYVGVAAVIPGGRYGKNAFNRNIYPEVTIGFGI